MSRDSENIYDVRWKSPLPYTLAFNLFKKHYTELNEIYWAFVPASNTIKKEEFNLGCDGVIDRAQVV